MRGTATPESDKPEPSFPVLLSVGRLQRTIHCHGPRRLVRTRFGHRIESLGQAVETPVGLLPTAGSLNLAGLDLPKADLDTLLSVDKEEWAAEVPEIRAFFGKFGSKLPRELDQSLEALARRVGAVANA